MALRENRSKKDTELLDANEKYALAMIEMRGYFDYLSKANEELDKKIFSLFSSNTIILAIFGIFGLNFSSDITYIQSVLLVLLGLALIFNFAWTMYGFFPRKAPFPYDGTYVGVKQVFIDKPSLSDSYEQIIVNYEENMKPLQDINKKKTRAFSHIMISYSISILLTIIIIFIS